jgi:hypothetical protein
MATGQKVSAAQERAFAGFVEAQGDKPFRRQDLAEVLQRHTTPRSMDTARKLADVFIQRLQATNKLVKAGHVHWRLVVSDERTLKSGRTVPDLAEVMKLVLDTRCPQKWAAVDLETGQGWVGAADGWKRADDTVRAEAAVILAPVAAPADAKAVGLFVRPADGPTWVQTDEATAARFKNSADPGMYELRTLYGGPRAHAIEYTDAIRGPLREKDRQDCMAFAASLGIRRDDADAVIRSAAAKGYVNGHKDAATGPAEVA